MRYIKGDRIYIIEQAIDISSAVEELHGLGSQEINKLLRNSEDYVLHRGTESGSLLQIDIEKLTWSLPLHLIAVLVSAGGDEIRLRYLLRGFRLLHSLCGLASQHTKLEQIILEEVKVTDQVLDLVFYMLIVLVRYEQEDHVTDFLPLLHSALVACSFHILTGYISSQWEDLVLVLLAHPKVDVFMDTAFSAVRIDVNYLHFKLSEVHSVFVCEKLISPDLARTMQNLCQQCEASLQFLQSLCQQQLFRERLLNNKELCKNGGVLSLAHTVLALEIPLYLGESEVVAAVSRLKSRLLTILLQLCETESISYLDEVASTPESIWLARSVALEVVELLRTDFHTDRDCSENSYPRGLVLLTSMRLVDVFSDDSNFRNFITPKTAEVLAEILSKPFEKFISSWCSTDILAMEEDASLEYDPFLASGVALASLSVNELNIECPLIINRVWQASYAQQKTSLLVKIIANLHCFVPNICEEQERNLFLNKVHECIQIELPKSSSGTSDALRTVTVCRNLAFLLDHTASLVPNFLSEEDVFLLRVFLNDLQTLPGPSKLESNPAQEHFDEEKIKGSLGCDKLSNLNVDECHEECEIQVEIATPVTNTAVPKAQEVAADLRCKPKDLEGVISESLKFQDDHQLSKRVDEVALNRSVFEPLREVNKDVRDVEMSGSDASSTRGNNSLDQMLDNSDFPKLAENITESGFKEAVEENEKEQIATRAVEQNEKEQIANSEEKQRRKRKRNIMNDKQIELIEQALLDEPEMQRHASLLQSWANTLSAYGSELTSSQLKNWLNNRKARLARAAAKGPRATSEGNFTDRQGGSGQGHFYDSPESPSEETYIPTTTTRRGGNNQKSGNTATSGVSATDPVDFAAQHSESVRYVPRCEPGQYVMFLDREGKEVGTGYVNQVEGWWHGKNLKEMGICVLDVLELKVDGRTELPHPSEATGITFDDAVTKTMAMRVAWDANKLAVLPR